MPEKIPEEIEAEKIRKEKAEEAERAWRMGWVKRVVSIVTKGNPELERKVLTHVEAHPEILGEARKEWRLGILRALGIPEAEIKEIEMKKSKELGGIT